MSTLSTSTHEPARPGAVGAAPRPSGGGMFAWVGVQVLAFLWLLVLLLFGPFIAMFKRELDWRAFFAGLALMAQGLVVVVLLTYEPGQIYEGPRLDALWAGGFAVMLASGVLIGALSRKVGMWETHLATLVLTGLVFVQLMRGWNFVLGLPGTESFSTWDLLALSPPGVRYLGPMYDRLAGLMLLGGFILALFGGSFAFLLFSDEGRLDPRLAFEWFISRRHLQREARGSVSTTAMVAVLGIALGVASLVAVTAVMSGYQEDIRAKILTTNAHLVVQKYGIEFLDYAEVEKKVLAVEGVLAATPFTFNEAMLSDGERGLGVLVKGNVPAEAGQVTGIEKNLCEPRADGSCVPSDGLRLADLLTAHDGVPSMVVGAELFKKIGKPIGSLVLMTTPVGVAGARASAPKRMEFRVTGVFRSGMHEFDARLAYVELVASQQLLGMGKSVNGVELKVNDPERVEQLGKTILRQLGRYPYRTLDWRELNAGIFTALNLQKAMMFIILVFIVVVASFNIASTLFMAVVERAREIGVLKSMGARDASIMKIFVTQGWIVGGVGTVLGVVLGLLVCALLAEVSISIAADVYMVDSLKVRVWPGEVVMTMVATFVISHLATVYPALKAARQRPVEAMRYD